MHSFLTKPVVLIGIMGAGKTTLGRGLANKLAVPFYDTDKEIEKKCHCKVSEVFYYAGEEYFRQQEVKVISELLETGNPSVISTGEGTYMLKEARDIIVEKAITIWVKAELGVLLDRVSRSLDTRPLLENVDKKAALLELIEARYPVYGQANIIIDTTHKSQKSTIQEIMQKLSDYAVA